MNKTINYDGKGRYQMENIRQIAEEILETMGEDYCNSKLTTMKLEEALKKYNAYTVKGFIRTDTELALSLPKYLPHRFVIADGYYVDITAKQYQPYLKTNIPRIAISKELPEYIRREQQVEDLIRIAKSIKPEITEYKNHDRLIAELAKEGSQGEYHEAWRIYEDCDDPEPWMPHTFVTVGDYYIFISINETIVRYGIPDYVEFNESKLIHYANKE